jgi:tRNA dimethylallyltransferase
MPTRTPHNDKTLVGRDRKKVPQKVSPHSSRRILLLIGPTGVGKSEVAFALAKMIAAEIVSADSRLVYRMMDIGTAKPSPEMRKAVPHHMIDLVDPDSDYTCKRFEIQSRQVIRDIVGRGRSAVVVGGSGLYLRALVNGIFEGPGRDSKVRKRLEGQARIKGKAFLWQELMKVDPVKARQIDPENMIRTVRALEVFEITGKPMSELEKGAKPLTMPVVKFGLLRDRIELYSNIERRVDRMMEMGFLREVEHLVDRGYGDSCVLRNCLGYRELLVYLEGSVSLDKAVEMVKKSTRNFAKRQITWFRKEKDVRWMDVTGRYDYDEIAREIVNINGT